MSNLVNANGEALNRDPLFKNTKRRLVEEIHALRGDMKKLAEAYGAQDTIMDQMEKQYLTVLFLFKRECPNHDMFTTLDLDDVMEAMEDAEVEDRAFKNDGSVALHCKECFDKSGAGASKLLGAWGRRNCEVCGKEIDCDTDNYYYTYKRNGDA